MRVYVLCYVNSQNGIIEHCATSDAPFDHSPIDPIVAEIPVEVPGGNPLPPLTYERHEFDVDTDENLIRAGDMLGRLEVVNGEIHLKPEHAQNCTICERHATEDFKAPFTKKDRVVPTPTRGNNNET